MNEFCSKVIWLFSLLSLASSIPFEESEAIYRQNGCIEGGCEIIEVDLFSYRRKRFADSSFSIPLTAFGRKKTLHLRQSSGILVGPNTPVYFASSSSNIKTRYGIVSSMARSQLYEDEVNMAAFTLDVDSDVPEIKYGVVHSENLIITPLTLTANSSGGPQRRYYLARSLVGDILKAGYSLFADMLGGGNMYFPERRRNTPVPSTIYPEVLIILDYSFCLTHGKSTFQHVIDIWNQIDALYRPLQKPRIKLSIAGIVIPMDSSVFTTLDSSYITDYEEVLKEISSWMIKAQSSIPFNSYDVHMIMTPLFHHQRTVSGMTITPSVCTAVNYQNPQGGIFRDDSQSQRYDEIVTGAHELGHAIGANHDDLFGISSGNLMGSFQGSKHWSEKSQRELQQIIRSRDVSCLDNYPETGSGSTWNSKPRDQGWSSDYNRNRLDDFMSADRNPDSDYGGGNVGSYKPRSRKPPASWNSGWSSYSDGNDYNDYSAADTVSNHDFGHSNDGSYPYSGMNPSDWGSAWSSSNGNGYGDNSDWQ